MWIMRFRTIALAMALALGWGAASTVHASTADKNMKRTIKRNQKASKARAKQANAKVLKVKPRKAKKAKSA